MKNALHKQEENQSFQHGFMDIVLCGLVIHIADARMNEYGERVLFPFVGAQENHSAMSLSNEVCRKVGSWSAMVDELYHFGALSLCRFSFCSHPIMAS